MTDKEYTILQDSLNALMRSQVAIQQALQKLLDALNNNQTKMTKNIVKQVRSIDIQKIYWN